MKGPAPRTPRYLLLVLLGAVAAVGCDIDKHCTSNADCGAQQACRPEVNRCPGTASLVTIGEGRCRYFGSRCSSDLDCVPQETCDPEGICRGPPPQCTTTPSCPAACPFEQPFPCACVCAACP